MTKEARPPTSINLSYLTDRPLVDRLRSTLGDCLIRSSPGAMIEEEGLWLVGFWVPCLRAPEFIAEAYRQSA